MLSKSFEQAQKILSKQTRKEAMKLISISLFNFRQFLGHQELRFGQDKNDIVTVVFGENGRGKTGIFRALMFCLFNERKLIQDSDTDVSEITLVNTYALEKNGETETKTFVEVEFSNKGINYVMNRQLLGIKKGNEIIIQDDGVSLHATGIDGNTQIFKQEEIDNEIHKILDARIKDYFLFDGERIERLTRASAEQRKEIAGGIRKLLNVDALERAKLAMDKLTTEFEAKSATKFSPEYARLIKDIRENEKIQQEHRERIAAIDKELIEASSEKNCLDSELNKIAKIRDFLSRRQELETSRTLKEDELRQMSGRMHEHPWKISPGLIRGTILAIISEIDGLRNRGEVPSDIKRELIERILEEGSCICGNPITPGSDAYLKISNWKERTNDHGVEDALLHLWRLLGESISGFEGEVSAAEALMYQYGQSRTEIRRIDSELEMIREKIGDTDQKGASELEQSRATQERRMLDLESERKYLGKEIEKTEKDLCLLKQKMDDEKKRQTLLGEIEKKSLLARDAHEALNSTHKMFTGKIKEVVGNYATEYFKLLIDKEGYEVLRSIIVSEDYSLQVLDRWNQPFLANISAGQRQIMSISFIIALAKAASSDNLLGLPLFMDTPFGRLSSTHRENLINILASIAGQWILLATDTEFRKQEAAALQKSGNWSKFYYLKPDGKGNTIIEEKKTEEAIAMLKDRG
jgi:DNA sulfur modification protein DndD